MDYRLHPWMSNEIKEQVQELDSDDGKRRKTQAVGKKTDKSSKHQDSEEDMTTSQVGDRGISSGKDGSTKESCGACLLF